MDFYTEATKNQRILNILDIPMGDVNVPNIPQYGQVFLLHNFQRLTKSPRWLASNETAWQQTVGMKGLVRGPPPTNSTEWATTATRNATSWPHLDANGLGTQVDNVAGMKYWVLFNRRRDLPSNTSLGNMASIGGLPDEFEPWSAMSDSFEHEAVVLQPGSLLSVETHLLPILAHVASRFMKPNTYHYVLTLENSITFGHHFYAASSIRNSIWGAVHCSLYGDTVTNIDHPLVTTFLRRMLFHSCWEYEHLIHGTLSTDGMCSFQADQRRCYMSKQLQGVSIAWIQ
jgi:hypothetical protein